MTRAKFPSNRLSDEDLRRMEAALESALYRNVYDFVARVKAEVVDELRFAPLGSELREARERRGLDLKAAARLIKAPQYVIRQIEDGRIPDSGLGPVERYASALGAVGAVERWKGENPELVLRVGRPKELSPLLYSIEQQLLTHALQGTQAPVATPRVAPVRGTDAGRRQALQLRIDLEETNPPIWRRVLVTDDTTLAGLHDVIQRAMGWSDSHLYQFEVNGSRYVNADAMDDPDPDDRDSRATRLLDLALSPHASFSYEYDFGDGWEHRITVERIGDVDSAVAYPTCLAGARACPPEDCGGPGGYQELLTILADPSHAQHAESMEWVGGAFDPESFDPALMNDALRSLGKRRPKQRDARLR